MFDALVFDLGGVIVAHDNRVCYERLAARCGPLGSIARVRALAENPDVGTGALTIPALYGQFQDEAAYGADWETFAQDWCCHLVLDAAMLGFIGRLSARNRVMLFSNTNQTHWDSQVEASGGRLGAIEHYLSHEIGHVKPSVRSFGVVAQMAGLDPARSVFFDDALANVEAAREAGFQAEVFESQVKLTAFLEAKGVPL